jgi:Glycosyl transferase family 90
MTRAMIVGGKLRILESKHMDDDHRKKGLAILHSIYRSIFTDGRPIPNIEFIFSIEDMVKHPTQPLWTLSRRSQDHNLWLMPDFGFWSWDMQDLGTIDDVVEQVTRFEASTDWASKIQKLVWRGKPQMLPKLRRALIDASKDKSWGDVAGLIPGPSPIPENYISAADQCKYMFLAHAEGEPTSA